MADTITIKSLTQLCASKAGGRGGGEVAGVKTGRGETDEREICEVDVAVKFVLDR
jgi:hypothetical protein